MNEEETTPPPPVEKPKINALAMSDPEYKVHRAKFVATKTPAVHKAVDKSIKALTMTPKEYAKYKRENY